MHNIDWNLVALFVLVVFVVLGAALAFYHVFITHRERKRYTPEEIRLVDILRGSEHANAHAKVRRALGSRAMLPATWKESQTR